MKNKCDRCGKLKELSVVPVDHTDGLLVDYHVCRGCKLDWENPNRLRLVRVPVQLFKDAVHLFKALNKHGLHGLNELVAAGERERPEW